MGRYLLLRLSLRHLKKRAGIVIRRSAEGTLVILDSEDVISPTMRKNNTLVIFSTSLDLGISRLSGFTVRIQCTRLNTVH